MGSKGIWSSESDSKSKQEEHISKPDDYEHAGKNVAGAWLVLGILTLVYITNIADRFVLSTLLQDIKTDFGLSDAATGFLTGVSLAIFYVTASIPLGALADRGNRKKLIAVCVSFWSVMTVCCGMSQNYWQMLLSRIGVGVGEAGSTPASHSLISDVFKPNLRILALSIFAIGASIGAWVGASGAGYLSELYGWRTTLIVFGLAGLPVALLCWLFVREPKRGLTDSHTTQVSNATIGETFKFSMRNKALFHVLAGATVITFWGWGILWWVPAFLMRSYDLTTGAAGSLMGPIYGIGGSILMIATALLMGWFKNKPQYYAANFVFLTTLIGTVASLNLFYVSDLDMVSMMLWIFIPIASVYIGPTTGLLQNLYPPQMRAKGAAILVFSCNIANLAIAPQLLGFLSDLTAPYLENPQDSMKHVLFFTAFTGFWAAYHYFKASRYLASKA